MNVTVSAVLGILYGFSGNYGADIALRVAAGMFSGATPASRAIIADVTDDSNASVGMAICIVGGLIGGSSGAAMGGFFARPCIKIPWIEKHAPRFVVTLFCDYPYLLSMLVAAIINMAIAIICCLKLKETKPESNDLHGGSDTIEPGEDASLINTTNEEEMPSRNDSTIRAILRSYVLILIAVFSLHYYAFVVIQEVVNVWVALKTNYGGLSFTTTEIGILNLIPVTFSIAIALYAGPWLIGRYGTKRVLLVFLAILTLAIMALPFARLIMDISKELMWTYIVFVFVVFIASSYCGLMTASILINSCCGTSIRGTVNGVAFSCSYLLRIIGLIAHGKMLSWSVSGERSFPFNYHFTFVVAAIVSFGAMVLVVVLPNTPGQL